MPVLSAALHPVLLSGFSPEEKCLRNTCECLRVRERRAQAAQRRPEQSHLWEGAEGGGQQRRRRCPDRRGSPSPPFRHGLRGGQRSSSQSNTCSFLLSEYSKPVSRASETYTSAVVRVSMGPIDVCGK